MILKHLPIWAIYWEKEMSINFAKKYTHFVTILDMANH